MNFQFYKNIEFYLIKVGVITFHDDGTQTYENTTVDEKTHKSCECLCSYDDFTCNKENKIASKDFCGCECANKSEKCRSNLIFNHSTCRCERPPRS